MDEPLTDREDRDEEHHELTPGQADAFVVGWTSFLAACVGTMLLFAFVDPLDFIETNGLPIGRMTGYAIGFFFLWMISLLSGGLCAYLLRTQHERTPDDTEQS